MKIEQMLLELKARADEVKNEKIIDLVDAIQTEYTELVINLAEYIADIKKALKK